MGRQIFQVRQGLVQKAKEKYFGFDLNRFWKWMAGELNVTTLDVCCDDVTDDAVPRPARFNKALQELEFFDADSWELVPLQTAHGNFNIDGTLSVGAINVGGVINIPSVSGLKANVINEYTVDSGVTLEGILNKDGGISSSGFYAGFFPAVAQQALSGAGAINVTTFHTAVTTTGANALTLANGTVIGQRKKITLVVDGGDGTLTPTSLSGGTTITFNDAGDYVELIWNGTAWVVIQNSGTTIA